MKQAETTSKKQGYANYKRKELLAILRPVLGKLVNISTGIEANLSKHSIDKMTSAKVLEKSKQNGFTLAELDEINKASERFQGLSDAAEKTADRATKTPHIDISNISLNAKKSNEAEK